MTTMKTLGASGTFIIPFLLGGGLFGVLYALVLGSAWGMNLPAIVVSLIFAILIGTAFGWVCHGPVNCNK